jgi:glycosyltransferase involved in cell wall biosynthesis
MSSRPLTIFVPHCSDLLTDYLPHGDGLVAHGFIRRLAERGHELYVAASEIELKLPLPSNVHLFPIRTKHASQIVSRIVYMRHVRRLVSRLHREVGLDLVHQMNPVFAGISLSLVGLGIPTILGTYVARWPDTSSESVGGSPGRCETAARMIVAGLQQCFADRLILTAPAALNRLPAYRLVRSKVTYLPHGIDSDFFSPAVESDAGAELSVLFLANLVKRKGILELISAFATVVREHPDCVLYVAGSGPALSAAQNTVQLLGIAKSVRFLGRVERSALTDIYRMCSVYCLPSDGEPYATSVLEAMSCGKPVVYTNAGGLPHMVGDEGGMGVAVGDVKGLSRALCKLLGDPARRKAMGEHNRRRVLETMTWDRVIDRLEEIYLAVIESTRHTRGARVKPGARLPFTEDCG